MKPTPQLVQGWFKTSLDTTIPSLRDFIQSVLKNYEHDDESLAYAIACCHIALSSSINKEFDTLPSNVVHDSFYEFCHYLSGCNSPKQLIDWGLLLNPDNIHHFNNFREIPPEVKDWLQGQAIDYLNTHEDVSDPLKKHLELLSNKTFELTHAAG